MRLGVPKEIKNQEYRVGLTPASVKELTARGHQVVVETGAGEGIGCVDDLYVAAGAEIAPHAAAVFETSELIVKVKEPQPSELKLLRRDQVLFTYLHLAPDRAQAEGLMASGCTAIAYETVTDDEGRLPLLIPMSAVAGRLAGQVGAHYLERPAGGLGLLLGGAPGVEPAKVVILGAGTVGTNALQIVLGLMADVTVINKARPRLDELTQLYGSRIKTVLASDDAIETAVPEADLVIGAALVPGATAPKLVTRDMIRAMRPGSVAVDVSIDQGGCFETSRATTHDNPTYVVDGVVHYCVANMPGAVPRTSTYALNTVTLPFVIKLAEMGPRAALAQDPHLLQGLNVHRGYITHPAVAEALGFEYLEAQTAIAA